MVWHGNSACYGSKGEWEQAAIDARECIKLNQDFIKGYYRLVTALMELDRLDEALETIRDGLKKDSGNAELQKQMRLVKVTAAR